VRALEEATSRSIELINALEHAKDRNAIIELMIDHLAESHRRSGFFAVKPLPKQDQQGRAARDGALSGTPPSRRCASIVRRRCRTSSAHACPTAPDARRRELHVFTTSSAAVTRDPARACRDRERVVGVLFGEHRVIHTFDDQLALAARAAGMALERVLKTKRS
jgi:hypothetical protein